MAKTSLFEALGVDQRMCPHQFTLPITSFAIFHPDLRRIGPGTCAGGTTLIKGWIDKLGAVADSPPSIPPDSGAT